MRSRSMLVVVLAALTCGPAVATDTSGGDGSDTSAASPVTTSTDPSLDASSVDPTGGPSTTVGPIDSSGDASSSTEGGSSESTGTLPVGGLTHVVVIRTPHGVYEDQVWGGVDESFVLGPVLDPLEPWSDALVLVDGLENAIITPDGELHTAYGFLSAALLTGGLLGTDVGPPELPYYYLGGGPSIDVVLGEALASRTTHANVHLGVEATDVFVPTGVSYVAADEPQPPFDSPQLAFEALFAGLADPLLDTLADRIDAATGEPGDTLALQLAIAHAVVALDVSRVQLLSIDRGLPAIRWSELGVFADYHEVVAFDEMQNVQTIQTHWAEQIAGLLAALEATASEDGGNLLDHTLVVWLSAEGSPPPAYSHHDIFTVVVDRSGTFMTGRIAAITGDQADFAVTIAAALDVDVPAFGHPDLAATPIAELLAR